MIFLNTCLFSVSIIFSLSTLAAKIDPFKDISGNIKNSLIKHVEIRDTLSSLLTKNGFSAQERNEIFNQDSLLDNIRIFPNQKYFIAKNKDLTELKIYDLNQDISHIFWKTEDGAGVLTQQEILQTDLEEIDGKIQGSVNGSIARYLPPILIQKLNDAYMEYDLRKYVRKNSTFKLVIEKKYDENEFIKYGKILEAHLNIGGEEVSKYFITYEPISTIDDLVVANEDIESNNEIISENEDELENESEINDNIDTALPNGAFVEESDFTNLRPFYAPIDFLSISSKFQIKRRHPITHRRCAHLGVDFRMASGSSIYAIGDGVITKMGRSRRAGNFIVIRHANDTESSYAHMGSLLKTLEIDQEIKAGQVIGQVGCTGYCTRPHLHFGLKYAGRKVNPVPFIKPFPKYAEEQVKARFSKLINDENSTTN